MNYQAPHAAISTALGYVGPSAINEACRIAVVAELRDVLDDVRAIRDTETAVLRLVNRINDLER